MTEKIVIGDSRFILHNVQRKETLYSIARQYNCTQEEILKANKDLKTIIKKGMILKIPDKSYKKPESVKENVPSFTNYRVVSGDNFYQLKQKFGIDEESLIQQNPALKDGLKAGMMLIIPVISQENIKQTTKDNTESPAKESAKDSITTGKFNKSFAGSTFQIGLYLPFSISESDSVKINPKTLSLLNFYQGSLMAVDRLTKEGMKVRLYVYDTENPSLKINKLTGNPEFKSLNLIIGPVYPDAQKDMAAACMENKIPFVSPLSPDDQITVKNKYCYQVNPPKELRLKTTAEYLVKEFSKENVIFLQQQTKRSDTHTIYDLFIEKTGKEISSQNHIKTYDLWEKGSEGLENLMEADHTNIIVMAENNEVNVSVSMNRLNLLSKKFNLILVGIQEFARFQSIDTEQLHNVSLRFLAPSHIDYSQLEIKQFIENFKTEFATEPTPFAFQGYDVTTWFITSLMQPEANTEKEYDLNNNLLHANYHFYHLSPDGGWMNDAFKVVEYAKTFDVKVMGTIKSSNE